LAAIDHNSHIGRNPKLTKNGKLQYNKVYSKRSKHWNISVIKEEKTYDYWPVVAYKVLNNRIEDRNTILRRVVIPAEHPKRIAPSIAMVPIPKTSDLVSKALTRFGKDDRSEVKETNSNQFDTSVENPQQFSDEDAPML
jgi:hypothetical protein